MLSMTGYGKGEYGDSALGVSVECKTVNNRYLDISLKMPKLLIPYEDVIRSLIKEKVTRGHIDVFINVTDRRTKSHSIELDLNVAQAYLKAAAELQAAFPEVTNDLSLTFLMKNPDILKSEETAEADETLLNALKIALAQALDQLNGMRRKEGAKLKADLLSRMDTIAELVEQIAQKAPLVVESYRVKLQEKISQFLQDVHPDESRLLTEVAVFADKCNIDEELTRLRSHIVQFRTIAESDLVGRKLDFLVQEFNRECNTICSKSNNLSITEYGLALKNEIEKVREQVQNLE